MLRAVRFSEFGGPGVLRSEVPEPHSGPGQIRVVVRACGVNPADWKIREGELGGELPRGSRCNLHMQVLDQSIYCKRRMS